jgi:hypothetical protein
MVGHRLESGRPLWGSGFDSCAYRHAGIAQMAEHRLRNPEVISSMLIARASLVHSMLGERAIGLQSRLGWFKSTTVVHGRLTEW